MTGSNEMPAAGASGDDGSVDQAKGRVLVVDDEAAVAGQLSDGLKMFGYDVVEASSVREARVLLEADPSITVVVTDIRMPDADGLGFARHIMAERDDATAVEVILITGHATIDDASSAMRARVVDFLRKPFRLREAAEAVMYADARAGARRRREDLRRQLEQKLRELCEASVEPLLPSLRVDDQ